MRLSVSNLAWPVDLEASVLPELVAAGIGAIEVAPTALWPDAPRVPSAQVRERSARWRDQGLAVSGIQSLLYGHPEHQVFDRGSWAGALDHLRSMIELAAHLGAGVAVFGSPRNRRRGQLPDAEADALAAGFLSQLVPTLADHEVVLTLEPNAPDYGADYLVHYRDTVRLADAIDSPWVQPQIDTGCLTLVGDDLAAAVDRRVPAHVHISAPQLAPPPGSVDHSGLAEALTVHRYRQWIVLEMLPADPDPASAVAGSARWMAGVYGGVAGSR